MRYEFRLNHDGKDVYDSVGDCYLNEDECVDKLNEQAAEIEVLKKLRARDKEVRG